MRCSVALVDLLYTLVAKCEHGTWRRVGSCRVSCGVCPGCFLILCTIYHAGIFDFFWMICQVVVPSQFCYNFYIIDGYSSSEWGFYCIGTLSMQRKNTADRTTERSKSTHTIERSKKCPSVNTIFLISPQLAQSRLHIEFGTKRRLFTRPSSLLEI